MSESPPSERTRYLEIDLIRSVAILFMIIYHFVADLALFYDFPFDPRLGLWLRFEQLTASLFLVTVGVSFAISHQRMIARGTGLSGILRKYARRGIGLILCGVVISAVTAPLLGSTWIRFGILHMIGVSILLLPFFAPLREGNALLTIVILLVSGIVTGLPADSNLLLPLGLTPPGFSSVDYFPLFPWFAVVLLGAALGNLFYVRNLLHVHLPDRTITRLITAPGRYALIIYLVHQPILLGILWIFLGKPNF